MTITQLGNLLGGIGLFLLGMKLLTDGLREAAGPALRHILALWTSTPLRGLFSGVFITSVVQSSAAVTIATIGFVNAGLLSLLQTVYVIYGSNIGTTMTGWLVTLVGFDFDIKLIALPLIGVGMGMALLGRDRYAAFGQAVAGFGIFFLGLDILRVTFGGIGNSFAIDTWPSTGPGLLLFIGAGFLLTFLMQSSSASIALTLTAAASGVIPLVAAAATVIGANIGTTSTAALSVIGATSNAQRVAAVHVLFNLGTGIVAFLLLQPFLSLVELMGRVFELDHSPATVLALFHTLFNILGVLLFWHATPLLVRFIEKKFSTSEEDLGRPHYLDRNVITTPALALNALVLELGRIGEIARTLARAVMSAENQRGQRLQVEQQLITRLGDTLREYTVEMQRSHLTEEISAALPNGLRVLRYYEETAEAALAIADTQHKIEDVRDPVLATLLASFRSEIVSLITENDALAAGYDAVAAQAHLESLESRYQALKAALLRAGAAEQIQLQQMVVQLEQHSLIRRLVEQTVKGARHLYELNLLAQQYRGVPATPAYKMASDDAGAGDNETTP